MKMRVKYEYEVIPQELNEQSKFIDIILEKCSKTKFEETLFKQLAAYYGKNFTHLE